MELCHGDVDYFKATVFDAYPEIRAAFAVRGYNNMDYNCPLDGEAYRRLANTLGVDFQKIKSAPVQVHGDECARINSMDDAPDNIDALMTNVPGISLVMRVADCIAVQVYDPVNKAIANIHSGWRGTLKRIAPKTVQKMTVEYGSKPEDLIIVLCPSIGPDHFEVKEDVRAQFEAEFGASHIKSVDSEHYLIDAPACVVDSLTEIGVPRENIHLSGICTVCQNDVIHSYRANIESEKQRRNASIICIM